MNTLDQVLENALNLTYEQQEMGNLGVDRCYFIRGYEESAGILGNLC